MKSLVVERHPFERLTFAAVEDVVHAVLSAIFLSKRGEAGRSILQPLN
jgi:hypothetical protein